MRLVRKAALLIAAAIGSTAVLGATGPVPAFAYTTTGCKWHSTTVAYGQVNDSSYLSVEQSAATAWSTTNTPILFSFFPGSPVNGIEVAAGNYGSTGWDGYSNWTCSGGISSSAFSRWNTYYTAGYSNPARESVMVHEFGHDLGLNHAGSSTCSGQPIMYTSSARYFTCGHVVPQADDVNGVNAIY